MNDMRFLTSARCCRCREACELASYVDRSGEHWERHGIVSCQDGRLQSDLLRCRCCGCHNVSNQAYGMSDVGLLKADAFSNLVELQTGVLPNTIGMNMMGGHLALVVSAVDSMSSRKTIWKSIRDQPNVANCILTHEWA
jgi:hypothetical protein